MFLVFKCRTGHYPSWYRGLLKCCGRALCPCCDVDCAECCSGVCDCEGRNNNGGGGGRSNGSRSRSGSSAPHHTTQLPIDSFVDQVNKDKHLQGV